MSCTTCSQTPCTCGSSPCSPANVVYQGACTDPGVAQVGRHLPVLDSQFCERRLAPGDGGFLVLSVNSSGTPNIEWTNAPDVTLGDFTATQGQVFGTLLVQNSDDVFRALTGPSVANLVLLTDANGNLYFDALPAATVPDPLTVTTLNATNYTLGTGTFTGVPQFTGLASGTFTSLVGLDGSGNLVTGTLASNSAQSVMFFESPTSPSAATPNKTATAGSLLVIGNEISSSLPASGALISVTNSQTLTVVQAGYFEIDYSGYVSYANAAVGGNPGIILLINGIAVANGNTRPDAALTRIVRGMAIAGFAGRDLAVGDTIQLQLAASTGAAPNPETYEVRLRATCITQA